MAKIQIKSEKLTPFGGIHLIRVRTTISIRLTLSILYYSIVCLHQVNFIGNEHTGLHSVILVFEFVFACGVELRVLSHAQGAQS